MTAKRVDGSVVPAIPANFRRDVMRALASYEKRIVGFHILLLVDSEDEEGCSNAVVYRDWPSRVHLIGHLEIAKQTLVCEVPEEESKAGA